MPKKVAVDEATEQAMIRLGDLIAECRGKTSLRTVAAPCGIPASQLQYIEKGIMSPTADIYPKLINTLRPCKEKRTEMDQLYMAIRKTPPPGVCNTIMLSNGLVEALSAFEGNALSDDQAQAIRALLVSFTNEKKGEKNHG